MPKLYTLPTEVPSSSVSHTFAAEDCLNDNTFTELQACVEGYCNAGRLYDSVANESYTLVDNKNKALYSAYSELMAQKLGVSMPALIKPSTASLEGYEAVSFNSEIAMEGWIGSLWEKIKSIFSKIYKSIQEFFKRNFTRLGRTKKALENLKSVLEKTEKNLTDADMTGYSGGLFKRYAGYGVVNSPNVKESLKNVGRLSSSIEVVNKSAEVMAKTHMVDKDFFTKIKSLKETATANDAVKTDIDNNTPGRLESAFSSDKRKERSSKKVESKTLGDISKKAKEESNSMDSEIQATSAGEDSSADMNIQKAKDQMTAFMEEVKKALESSVNTKLISGKVIKSVVVSDTFELDVESDAEPEDANTLVLAGKSDMLSIVSSALAILKEVETGMTKYGEINDVIMKNIDTIDSLVNDIDKIDPEKYGKYKRLINEQVRERLQMLRKFFSAYNKVGKNILDLSVDASGGVVDYGVLSLKHYG